MEKKRMRLIDANNVIDDIKWEMGETYDDDVRAGMRSVIDIINKRRTAYDVDKVVEQLEELEGRYNSVDFGIKGIICKAIEIVKAGRIDER